MEGKELSRSGAMGVKVTPSEQDKSVSIEQLEGGQFAEADNGTIVLKLDGALGIEKDNSKTFNTFVWFHCTKILRRKNVR